MTDQRSYGHVMSYLKEPCKARVRAHVIANHIEWFATLDTPVSLGICSEDPAVLAATFADAVYELSQAEDLTPQQRAAVAAVVETLHDDVSGAYITPREIVTEVAW